MTIAKAKKRKGKYKKNPTSKLIRKKRVVRRAVRVGMTADQRNAYQLEALSWMEEQKRQEQRRTVAAERAATALEVIAQYVADFATQNRVTRMLKAENL